MNKKQLALLLGTIFTIVASLVQSSFSGVFQQVRDNTIRVHIVANSNDYIDQAVKLEVRDEILVKTEGLLNSNSKQQAVQNVEQNLSDITVLAEETLAKNGFDYQVKAYLCEMFFEERTYDGEFTLPAGNYTALRVELGEAAGENWWCVLYPQLCVPSAVDTKEITDKSLGEKATEVLTNKSKYTIAFKTEEIIQKIFNDD